MKNTFRKYAMAVIAVLTFEFANAVNLVRKIRARSRYGESRFVANEIQGSVHCKTITKFSANAIATRHLLYGIDPADATGRRLVLPTTGIIPQFAVADEVQTTDLTLTGNYAPVAAIMLGVTDETVRMVANSAGIGPGAKVFALANGMVDIAANIPVATGVLYIVGIVVNRVSTAQGDLLEVASDIPTTSQTF